MEVENNHYYPGTNRWFNLDMIDQKNCFSNLANEVFKDVLEYLTPRELSNLRLVCKKWAILVPSLQRSIATELSPVPAPIPFPFVTEFLKKSNILDLNAEFTDKGEFISYSQFCQELTGIPSFSFPDKKNLKNLSENPQQAEYLMSMTRTVVERRAYNQGMLDEGKIFRIVYACEAKTSPTSLFSKEAMRLPIFCDYLRAHQNSLTVLDLRTFEKTLQFSNEGIQTVLACLKDLKKIEVLNLEGMFLSENSSQSLIDLMKSNPKLRSVHLSKDCLAKGCQEFIDKEKPKRRGLKIQVHRLEPSRRTQSSQMEVNHSEIIRI